MFGFLVIILAFTIVLAECNIEGFIVGGTNTNIERYPHSVLLNIECSHVFVCGGSILNQNLVLTAGHCLDDCDKAKQYVTIKYGHENFKSGLATTTKEFRIHKDYDSLTMENDIALVHPKRSFVLGPYVKRVVIMRKPPYRRWAAVAGWGMFNNQKKPSEQLKEATQEMRKHDGCHWLGEVPRGTFCAGPVSGTEGVPAQGDSGSALVVKHYIQVGLVSYKISKYSLTVYSNVSYHYDWIKATGHTLVCQNKIKRK